MESKYLRTKKIYYIDNVDVQIEFNQSNFFDNNTGLIEYVNSKLSQYKLVGLEELNLNKSTNTKFEEIKPRKYFASNLILNTELVSLDNKEIPDLQLFLWATEFNLQFNKLNDEFKIYFLFKNKSSISKLNIEENL